MTEVEDKYVCPNCGGKMKRTNDTSAEIYVCQDCGSSMEISDENLDSYCTCPNCNQILDDGSECPFCGYDLGSDFD